MNRPILMLCAIAALGPAVSLGFAAEPTLAQEVHEMRRDLQGQARQIEALTQQISKLTHLFQERDQPKAGPEQTAAGPAPTTKPAPDPLPEIPRAEAVPPPLQHVVEKGETLTSIAKHYNIALTDLQKQNTIANDRKLQIGQTLIIPATKAPETPSQKKENP